MAHSLRHKLPLAVQELIEHLPTAPDAIPHECAYWDAVESGEEALEDGEEKEGLTHA